MMRYLAGKGCALLALSLVACGGDPASTGGGAAGLGGGGMGGTSGAAGSGADSLGGGAPLGGGAGAPSDSNADTKAPSIVSVSPSDGALGVPLDARIVVTFSEPMDMGAVQRAFESPELGVNDVSFQWNLAGTELTVTPNRPLAYAFGDETVEPLLHTFSLTSEATDLAGNALAKRSFSFGTVRRIERTLLPNKAHSGTVAPDAAPGSSVSAEVGERSTSPTVPRRGYFTFDLGVVADGTKLEAARLQTVVTVKLGDPFGTFTTLRIEALRFDALETNDYALTASSTIANVTAAGTFTQEVTERVQADLDDPTNQFGTQIRIQFPSATGGHGIHIAGVAPTLRLAYFAE